MMRQKLTVLVSMLTLSSVAWGQSIGNGDFSAGLTGWETIGAVNASQGVMELQSGEAIWRQVDGIQSGQSFPLNVDYALSNGFASIGMDVYDANWNLIDRPTFNLSSTGGSFQNVSNNVTLPQQAAYVYVSFWTNSTLRVDAASVSGSGGQNLITNGDFSSGLGSWATNGSVILSQGVLELQSGTAIWQGVNGVEASQRYTVSVDYVLTNGFASYSIDFYDENFNLIARPSFNLPGNGSNSFNVTAPPNAAFTYVSLWTSGTLRVSQITMRPRSSDLIKNGDFNSGLASWETIGAVDASQSIMTLQAGESIWQEIENVQGGQTYTLSVGSALASGFASATFDFYDANWNLIDRPTFNLPGDGQNTFEVTAPSNVAYAYMSFWTSGALLVDRVSLSGSSVASVVANGEWGNVFNTQIMGIHSVLLNDGRVLFWGDDGSGNAFSDTLKYAAYNPRNGGVSVLTDSYAVRMFCGAGMNIPGTDQILIAGGNAAGDDDGRIFDASTETLSLDPQNEMTYGRFYPTMVSLSSGQVVILGGREIDGQGVGTPEIFTPGQGWRTLTGAFDSDVQANWWYPRAWVNNQGEILYIAVGAGSQVGGTNGAGNFELMALNPSGAGTIRQVAEVPFRMDVRSPAVMFDIGKIAMMDHVGDLWIMDINGATPTFTFAADLPADRENGDMTVLPNGTILLNGGTRSGNSQDDADAAFQSVIFNPYNGDIAFVDSESVLRAYHSSSILLPDGTVMSSGGGGLGAATRDFQDAQIYRPGYLFTDGGTPAARPTIWSAPPQVQPGNSFIVNVADAYDVSQMSFVKNGAVTHSLNMEAGRMDLSFNVISSNEIMVTLPQNPHVVGAGNWMLFAIDANGVPSEAAIITVQPTL